MSNGLYFPPNLISIIYNYYYYYYLFQCHLATLLKTAEELRIKGLAEVSWRDEEQPANTSETNSNGVQTAIPQVTSLYYKNINDVYKTRLSYILKCCRIKDAALCRPCTWRPIDPCVEMFLELIKIFIWINLENKVLWNFLCVLV